MNSQHRAFPAAFRETGNVRLACEVAKVGRSSHYRWREHIPEYREAFDLAKGDAGDTLGAEAYRRAVEGTGRTDRMVRRGSEWHRASVFRCAAHVSVEVPCARRGSGSGSRSVGRLGASCSVTHSSGCRRRQRGLERRRTAGMDCHRSRTPCPYDAYTDLGGTTSMAFSWAWWWDW